MQKQEVVMQRETTEMHHLPTGWRWVKLDDVCELNPRRPKSFARSPNVPTTFIPMAAVDDKTGAVAKPEIVPYSKVSKGYTYFEENDVLFAKITPCMQNGKHVIARNLIDRIGFGTTEFHVLHPAGEVLPEWIYFFIRQPYFLRQATAYFTGAVGQQRVPEGFLSEHLIPLPPMTEQKHIIAKIQELMQQVEHTRTACEKQLKAAKALPAAYLRTVFESDESKKWERKKLGEACKVITGATPKTSDSANWNGDILWATPNDMGKLSGFTIGDTERRITDAGFKSCSTKLLPPWSVLLTTRAPIGYLAINTKPICTNQGFKSFIPSPQVYSWYLFFALKYVIPLLQSMGRGQAFTEISKRQVEGFKIPIPTFVVQHCIATELKEKMTYAEKLRIGIEEQLKSINALPQSILRRAFTGKL